jgi:hypothetical protein
MLCAASGGLAQLGEHLLCKQGVVGSIPSSSTNLFNNHLSASTIKFSQDNLIVYVGISNRLFFNNLKSRNQQSKVYFFILCGL